MWIPEFKSFKEAEGIWFGEQFVTWSSRVWCQVYGNRNKLHSDNEEIIYRKIVDWDGRGYLMTRLLVPNPRGVRKHRVEAVCPRCKAWVPAGRIFQHKCKS